MGNPWNNLIDQLHRSFDANPALREFVEFPTDLAPSDVVPFYVPAAKPMEADRTPTPNAALRDAFVAASPAAQWRETYKGTDIGQDFMDRFACYCLIGPGGAFKSDQAHAYVVYMPPRLHYPWHQHPAEELYFVIAGEAEFHRDGVASETLKCGDTSFHASNQPHAMTTGDSSVMALVLWRNEFDTPPILTPAS